MKMKKLFYMLPLLAIFASCGFGGDRNSAESSQTSDYTSDVTSADETAYAETSESQSEISNDQPYIFNDLTAGLATKTPYDNIEGDLKGNIKRMEIVQDSYCYGKMEFDRNGYLKRFAGAEYSDYVFDSQGRMESRRSLKRYEVFKYYDNYVIEKNVDSDGNIMVIYKYDFNKNGKLISTEVIESGYIEYSVDNIQRGEEDRIASVKYSADVNFFTQYYYAENVGSHPLVKSVVIDVNAKEDLIDPKEEEYTTVYFYQTDSHGNWIKKSPSENFDVDVVERHIEYY